MKIIRFQAIKPPDPGRLFHVSDCACLKWERSDPLQPGPRIEAVPAQRMKCNLVHDLPDSDCVYLRRHQLTSSFDAVCASVHS